MNSGFANAGHTLGGDSTLDVRVASARFVPLSEAVAAIVKVTATDTSAGSTHGQGALDGLRGLFMGHVWLPETVSRT